VGLWLINPDKMVSMDSVSDEVFYGNGAFPEKAPLLDGANQSASTAGYVMEVLRVDEDSAVVSDRQDGTITQDTAIAATSFTLTYENLKEAPQLRPGQRIRIYYQPEALDKGKLIVRPYKIEIIEEETQ
jgi:hypothetical protein